MTACLAAPTKVYAACSSITTDTSISTPMSNCFDWSAGNVTITSTGQVVGDESSGNYYAFNSTSTDTTFQNSGYVTTSGTIMSDSNLAIAGVLLSGGTVSRVENAGTIEATGLLLPLNENYIGGIVNLAASVSTITNSGTISASGFNNNNNNNGFIGAIINKNNIIEIENASGGVLSSASTFGNAHPKVIINLSDGTIGSIINASGATITAQNGTAIYNQGGSIGAISNSGTILSSSTAIYNLLGGAIGTITNSGTISSTGAVYASTDAFLGAIVNSGIMTSASSSAFNIYGGTIGSIVNSGTISSMAWTAIYTEDSEIAVLTNQETGEISAQSTVIQNTSTIGTLTNHGIIKALSTEGGMAVVNDRTIATIANSGTISADSIAIYNNGATSFIGNLTNSGVIAVTYDSAITNHGIINALVNEASGTIRGAYGAAVNLEAGGTIVQMTNDGLVEGTGEVGILTTGLLQTLTNNGRISGASTGISVNSGGIIATLVNSGTIVGYESSGVYVGSTGSIGTLTNSGLITTTGGYGIGTRGSIGTLSNSGTIEGPEAGVRVRSGSIETLTNAAGGTIRGDSVGVLIDTTIAAAIGKLTNDGLITGVSSGISVDNLDGSISDLRNNGTIASQNSGIYNTGTIGALGNSGIIKGDVYAIHNTSSGTLGAIANSGVIAGNIGNESAFDLTISGGEGDAVGTLTGSGGSLGASSKGLITNTNSNLVFAGGNILLNDDIAIGAYAVKNNGSTISLGTDVSISGTYEQTGGLLGLGGNTLSLVDLALSGGTVTNGTVTATTSYVLSEAAVSAVLAGAATLSASNVSLAQNNTYTGETTVTEGVLSISADNALGATSAGTTVLSGATLRLSGSISVGAEALALSGEGAAGSSGALQSLSGDNAYGGAITLGGDTTIGVDAATLILSGGVTGADGTILSKAGAGTLILTSTADVSAKVSGGALQIGNGGSTGDIAGDVQLAQDTSLIFKLASDKTYAGLVSGNGGLVQAGTGVLTLTRANTYSGGTTISAGTLSIAAADNIGTGALTLAGSGTLKARETFGLSQSVQLMPVSGSGGGTFDVDATKLLTLSGTIAGSGSLTKTGSGTLQLTGANTYTGGTTILEGTLKIGNGGVLGSILGDIVNQATLIIDRSDDYAITGSVTGTGTLLIEGGGSVSFSSPYQGAVEILASSVVLQSGTSSAGAFTVGSDGYLGGTGTIGSLTMNSGSTVSPGYSPGTLNVSGAVTFNSGSIYRVDVTSGAHDLIVAGGNVTLSSGAYVQVAAASGLYAPSSRYAIITTSGTVAGTFGGVTSNYQFLTPTLDYDAQNVYLILTYTGQSFSAYAQTTNQQNTANAAYQLGAGNGVFNAVAELPVGGVPLAMNQLSGEIYASANTVLMDQANTTRNAVVTRLRQGLLAEAGSSALTDAAGAAGPATARFAVGWTPTLWAQGYGGWSTAFGNGNAATVSSSIGGIFAGLDALIAQNTRAGIVAGFSQTQFEVNDRNSNGSSDNYELGAYVGGQYGWLGLKGGASYAWFDLSLTRTTAFPGFSGSTNSGYTQGMAQVFGEVSARMAVSSLEFEPFAAVAYVNLQGGSTQESASTPAALAVDVSDMSTTYTTLGLRLATKVDLNGRALVPSATVGWQHAFGDTVPLSTMQFLGGAQSFAVQGVPIAEDTAILGAGLGYALSQTAALQVNYLGQIASSVSNNAFNAQFSLKF